MEKSRRLAARPTVTGPGLPIRRVWRPLRSVSGRLIGDHNSAAWPGAVGIRGFEEATNHCCLLSGDGIITYIQSQDLPAVLLGLAGIATGSARRPTFRARADRDRPRDRPGGSAAAGARTVMKSTTLVMPVRLMIARLANCRGPAVGHVASRHLVRLGACGRQFTPEAKSFVMQIPAPERHLYPAGQSLSTFSSVMDFTVVLARIPGLLECALVQKFKTYHGNLKLLPDPRP